MELKRVTLTGIDAKVDVNWVTKMRGKYLAKDHTPVIEFGILRSPKVDQSPRYPNREAIRKITNYVYPNHLAFHLCGRYARMVFSMEWAELCDIVDFSLVGRVQVNSGEYGPAAILKLQQFSVHIGRPVIMQWRQQTFPYVPKIFLLQDRSGGNGIVETQWANPSIQCAKSGNTIGFAGGLGPDNILEALPKIHEAAGTNPFWIDCESSLRTDDWFDTDKAEAMLDAVYVAANGALRKSARSV